MSSLAISMIVFACMFGGAMLGMFLRAVLPHDRLRDSQDAVKLGMGLVATMSALVLGLLVTSARVFYETQNNEVTEMSAKVIMLDRVLAAYGTETKEARDLLRDSVVRTLDQVWPRERTRVSGMGPPPSSGEVLLDKIQALSPKDDRQRWLQAQALSLSIGLGQTRWLVYGQATTSVSTPMIVFLVFWLSMIFLSFGLYAPPNGIVTVAFFIAGLSVSGAIFLILDMYAPYRGLIEISSAPLRVALSHLGQ
jgi:hypothetical protein